MMKLNSMLNQASFTQSIIKRKNLLSNSASSSEYCVALTVSSKPKEGANQFVIISVNLVALLTLTTIKKCFFGNHFRSQVQ